MHSKPAAVAGYLLHFATLSREPFETPPRFCFFGFKFFKTENLARISGPKPLKIENLQKSTRVGGLEMAQRTKAPASKFLKTWNL
jgi:hypothetical protein